MKSQPVSLGSVRIACILAAGDKPRLTRGRGESPAVPARSAAGVQLVEDARVLLVDDVALDLQRGRQLAGCLREVVVEDRELLDLLDLRVLCVGAVDLALDQLADGGLARE